MNVSDLYAKLSYGELSNLSIGTEGGGTILEARRPQIIQFANSALTRLYSRFILRQGNILIQEYTSLSMYELSSRYAATNPDPIEDDILFILDTESNPFQDDVVKILAVYDMCGLPYALNDEDVCTSLFTPQPHILQIPCPVDERKVSLVYQAQHSPLTGDDPDNELIYLPKTLEDAMTAYIAHMVYLGMNGQEHRVTAGDHLDRYEGICMEVLDKDLVNSSLSNSGTKFDKRGFV
jgi:hypothetical protein